ncbi:HesA/MoeB/ThiF family protein [Microbulbifer harenosus]|uniref:HesA/MoeB/ThiF family protein n=1 Tax=Microbulbifer harenosus TaxID=2576840 RepID=A0ABY2UD80_9GAMM|nr:MULTISPECIES: HesA/MoeB/ThiF family protein [Microbulbifer]QIL90567.1 HesA/MoeB/ThiF family protein [Microbulbifer sp. SH-1]TLM74340.1 HesA/MoeB/ThiF family protein [Microbulbifer harenosus]
MISHKDRIRYSRQIMLPQMGEAAQEKLASARVMVVGLGGLGCPAALYLASAGIGELHLVDGDTLALSNLQRQILYKSNHIHKPKALVAAQQLGAVNPHIRILPYVKKASEAWLSEHASRVDLVLDCTDNQRIRQSINRVCREMAVPVIMASVQGFSGQLVSFDFRRKGSPCYTCFFPDTEQERVDNCETSGVIGPALGIVGSAQSLEAIKLLAGLPLGSLDTLQVFEAETLDWRRLSLGKERCAGCAEPMAIAR